MNRSKTRIFIGGMTCVNCQNKIETALLHTAGIETARVSYQNGTADLVYDPDWITLEEIQQVIRDAGYEVLSEKARNKQKPGRAAHILIVIAVLYVLLENSGILNRLVPSQLADTRMGYGMLLAMLSQGFSLSGLLDGTAGSQVEETLRSAGPNMGAEPLPESIASSESEAATEEKTDVQIVQSTLSGGRYPNITVKAGTPVRWIIDVPKGALNGCNYRMVLRAYGISHTFSEGENVIEFTPEETGTVNYTCWMGMIRGKIFVTDEEEKKSLAEDPAKNAEISEDEFEDSEAGDFGMGCCGGY